jgi:hypothetical protein
LVLLDDNPIKIKFSTTKKSGLTLRDKVIIKLETKLLAVEKKEMEATINGLIAGGSSLFGTNVPVAKSQLYGLLKGMNPELHSTFSFLSNDGKIIFVTYFSYLNSNLNIGSR